MRVQAERTPWADRITALSGPWRRRQAPAGDTAGGARHAEGVARHSSAVFRQGQGDSEQMKDGHLTSCCRATRLVGLSSAWESVGMGSFWLRVIGRMRLHLVCPAKMPSLGTKSQAQDYSPKVLRAQVVCNQSLASPDGSLCLCYNMPVVSSTSHVSTANLRPLMSANS